MDGPLKGFLKLWLWGLMTKYKVNNSYHPCSLPPLPQKGAPMSKWDTLLWPNFILSQGGSHKDVDGNVAKAVVLSVSLIVRLFLVGVGVYLLLLLVVVSKVRVAVAMTHDQMRSEGGNIVDTCLMTTSSSLSSPSVLSLTPPSNNTHISINNLTPHTPSFTKQHQGI